MKKHIPNILSVIRLLCIPFFVWVFWAGNRIAAAGVFFFASATDVLDGYLARRNNWITNVGKILDPVADKLMQFTVLLCLTIDFKDDDMFVIPLALLILFSLKELTMMVGAIIVMRTKHSVVASFWYGKFATAVIFVLTVTMILYPHNAVLNAILCGLLIITILFALIMYYIKIFRGLYGIKNFENMRRTKE
ncbi:MAG: CDP-alcohol phosphatidyltransferase family protein [Clostridia bacterium]|nr:CDP-alcohol phosphatidyltransferase family protein [Clostridia bacterium]